VLTSSLRDRQRVVHYGIHNGFWAVLSNVRLASPKKRILQTRRRVFGETPGTTTAADTSGHSNTLTYQSSVSLGAAGAVVGDANRQINLQVGHINAPHSVACGPAGGLAG
jgi:hypothetical protein